MLLQLLPGSHSLLSHWCCYSYYLGHTASCHTGVVTATTLATQPLVTLVLLQLLPGPHNILSHWCCYSYYLGSHHLLSYWCCYSCYLCHTTSCHTGVVTATTWAIYPLVTLVLLQLLPGAIFLVTLVFLQGAIQFLVTLVFLQLPPGAIQPLVTLVLLQLLPGAIQPLVTLVLLQLPPCTTSCHTGVVTATTWATQPLVTLVLLQLPPGAIQPLVTLVLLQLPPGAIQPLVTLVLLQLLPGAIQPLVTLVLLQLLPGPYNLLSPASSRFSFCFQADLPGILLMFPNDISARSGLIGLGYNIDKSDKFFNHCPV